MATKVQATTTSASSATSFTIALSGVAQHNCLILKTSYIDGAGTAVTPTKSTDSNGTVSVAIAPTAIITGGGTLGTMIEYVPDCASGTHTFTVNPQNHANQLFAEASLEEWSGLTTTPLDKTQSNQNTTTGAGITTGNTGTTATLSQSNELVVAVLGIVCTTGTTNAGISTPATTGYSSVLVQQNTSVNVGAEHSYKEANSTSGQIATWTWTGDATRQADQECIATFLETSATVTTPLPTQLYVMP